MKFAALLAVVLCSTQALKISPHLNHEDFFDSWNQFWNSFGKDNPTTSGSKAEEPKKQDGSSSGASAASSNSVSPNTAPVDNGNGPAVVAPTVVNNHPVTPAPADKKPTEVNTNTPATQPTQPIQPIQPAQPIKPAANKPEAQPSKPSQPIQATTTQPASSVAPQRAAGTTASTQTRSTH